MTREPGYFATTFDTQFHLHWLPLVDSSERQNLLPGTYFHIALEQVAGDDEMLDIIQPTSWLGKWQAIHSQPSLIYSFPDPSITRVSYPSPLTSFHKPVSCALRFRCVSAR